MLPGTSLSPGGRVKQVLRGGRGEERGAPGGKDQPGWAGVYLEGDLCQASCALDVEAEDGQAQVGLVLHGLLARVELLALVDVLSARLTPVGQDRGTQAITARWCLLVGPWHSGRWLLAYLTGQGAPPFPRQTASDAPRLARSSYCAPGPWPRGPLPGKRPDDPDLLRPACRTLAAASASPQRPPCPA